VYAIGIDARAEIGAEILALWNDRLHANGINGMGSVVVWDLNHNVALRAP